MAITKQTVADKLAAYLPSVSHGKMAKNFSANLAFLPAWKWSLCEVSLFLIPASRATKAGGAIGGANIVGEAAGRRERT